MHERELIGEGTQEAQPREPGNKSPGGQVLRTAWHSLNTQRPTLASGLGAPHIRSASTPCTNSPPPLHGCTRPAQDAWATPAAHLGRSGHERAEGKGHSCDCVAV